MTDINLFNYQWQALIDDNTRTDDQWVNATKWCEYFGKEWSQIAKQPTFKAFLKALQRIDSAQSDKKSVSKNGKFVQVKGNRPKQTWIHPLVAIKLAEWLSPEFDIFVKETFKRFLDGDITLADEIIQRSGNNKDLDWIIARAEGKKVRNQFTQELKNRGVTGYGYALNTNAINIELFDHTAQEIKEIRQIENVRENMSDLELTALKLAELKAIEKMRKTNSTGNKDTVICSKLSGKLVRQVLDN